MRESGGAENEREAQGDELQRAVRRFETQARSHEVLHDLPAFVVIGDMADGVKEVREAEMEVGHHQDAEQERSGHQQHGLDDLHPGGGQHAAEDHIDDHQDADADDRVV